jgi:sirohydrochlorin ferrochelatase
MRSILIIDHGSVKPEANQMLSCVANLLQHMVGRSVLVRHAHMELAEPSIAQGFAECVRAGATDVFAFPYMLSPGKHTTRDIPRLVGEAATGFPQVTYRVSDAFGVTEQLAEVIAQRAGIEVVARCGLTDGTRCWDSAQHVDSCGVACSAHGANRMAPAT